MGYKQAHRKEDDIATVNAGIRVRMDHTFTKVKLNQYISNSARWFDGLLKNKFALLWLLANSHL